VITQHVNLFQPIFRKERKLLSFRVFLQACALSSVMLLLLYGWSVRQTQQLAGELALIETQQARTANQLVEVSARLANMKTDSKPQQTLSKLERELIASRKVVYALTRVRNTYSQGVSAYLESFSRQSPQGVWLTGFTVQAGGEGLVIRGSALKPELVPAFLQGLSTESSLSGTEFGLLQIQRDAVSTRFVNFTVYTGTVPPEGSHLSEDHS